MNEFGVNVPDDTAIAASLGIEDLRVGRHYLRDKDRARVGAIWLDTIWMLEVQPTFRQGGLVGVAAAHGEEFRGKSSSGWIKGFLASSGAFAVHELESDPLPNVITGLPLLQKINSFVRGFQELRVMWLGRVGRAAMRSGDFARAEERFRKAVFILEHTCGDTFPTDVYLVNLGVALTEQRKYIDAEPYFRRALAIAETDMNRSAKSSDYRFVIGATDHLAHILKATGREEEARQLAVRVATTVSAYQNAGVGQ